MFIGLRNNDDIGTFFTQDGLNGETISHINDYKFEYTEKSMLMQAVWFLLAVVLVSQFSKIITVQVIYSSRIITDVLPLIEHFESSSYSGPVTIVLLFGGR